MKFKDKGFLKKEWRIKDKKKSMFWGKKTEGFDSSIHKELFLNLKNAIYIITE